jgi:hypothetical protein
MQVAYLVFCQYPQQWLYGAGVRAFYIRAASVWPDFKTFKFFDINQ